MSIANLIFGSVMVVGTALGLTWAFINYRRHKRNVAVATELDKLIHSALDVVSKNKARVAEEQKRILSELQEGHNVGANLDSPMLLSTMLTVLINKFGDVRLSMRDFMIPDEEYVSVYVDVDTKELILSTNHELTLENSYSMASFTDTDDNTFH